MTKMEKIKKVIKRNRSGLTIHEICAKSDVEYSTARRHISRLLERNEIAHGDYYKLDSNVNRYLFTYVSI